MNSAPAIPVPPGRSARRRFPDGHRTGRTDSPTTLRRVLRALLTIVGSALLLLTLATTPAAAHAGVVATTPTDRAVMEQAPTRVTVQFTEPVLVTADAVRVLAADGTRVDTGGAATESNQADTVAVALRPGIADGTYTVAWRATSTDSHPVHGAFTFSVGAPGADQAPLAGADKDSDPLLSAVMVAARGVGYVGLALLIGATGILALVAVGTDRTRIRTLVSTGGFLVIGSAAVALVTQGPYAAGDGPGALLESGLLRSTLGDRTGIALVARILLAAVAMAMPAMGLVRTAPSWRARAGNLPALLPALALTATFSATGHAAAGYQVPVAFTADIAHLVTMGLWLGGLVALAALFLQRIDPELLAVTTRRFSPMAAACVAVLVVTGSYQGWRQVGVLGDLFTTEYGRLLVLKVIGVLVVLALASGARRWTHRYAPVDDEEPQPPEQALGSMRRTLLLEAAGGAAVLVLTTLLAGSPPPREQVAPPVAAAPVQLKGSYDTGGAAGKGTMTARVTQRANGDVALDLRLADSSGAPARPKEVSGTWSLTALEIGPLPMTLKPQGAGHWTASVHLAPAGDWSLAMTVRTSDIDQDTVTFTKVPVGGGTAPATSRPAAEG